MIRALDTEDDGDRRGGGRGGGSSKKLEQGDKVEARHGGGSKWYPGTITRCRLNGSYDIHYDDGERETGVEKGMIRALDTEDDGDRRGGGRGGGGSSKKLEQGDKVEARHGGGSKWYPGTITRCRLNGSYDIRYDDGDREQGV